MTRLPQQEQEVNGVTLLLPALEVFAKPGMFAWIVTGLIATGSSTQRVFVELCTPDPAVEHLEQLTALFEAHGPAALRVLHELITVDPYLWVDQAVSVAAAALA